MKSQYKLTLYPKTGIKTVTGAVAPVEISFRGTMWQANNAFHALSVALHESEYKQLDLHLCPRNCEAGYKVNGAKVGGLENGV